jgi:hypothetical protein
MISELETTTGTPRSTLHAPRQAFTFSIPSDQAVATARSVPMGAMEEARKLLNAMEEIHAAPKVLPACKRLSASMKRSGWSAHRLRTRYYEFVRGTDKYSAGDWRILLNKSKARVDNSAAIGTRFKFHEFWRTLGERNHQDWAAAHDELLKIFKTGYDNVGTQYTAIPGYDKWPEPDPFYGYPEGWSYANLMRHQSDPYDQVAARIGHAKASQFRLPVLTTRVGLEFGQYFEFDDHEFNQRVLFQKKPMRPLGFGAVEVLSACVCHIGLKPTLWDFEEEVKRKLTEREFMWFVVALLMHVGYRQDIGTTFIGERGTAKLTPEFIERMARISGDKLSWFVGGRFGQPAHSGQFDGRSKGNFRTKKLIEGSWAIVDNQTGSLPAQTGRSRDDAPEGFAPQAGAEQYTNRLIKAASNLTPEQAEQLKFPYPFFWQWRDWALDAIHRINTDPNHYLEGWEKLRFVQPIWRLPATSNTQWLPWTEFLKLPPEQQAIVKSMLDKDSSLVSTHRFSRHDVFERGRALLKPMPWELLPQLVGPENALASPIKVERGLFSFECADIDPDPIQFYARDHNGNGFLANGEKYTCYVNPYCPTHLVACDSNGKVVSVCPRYVRAVRTDTEAVQKLMGDQQSFEAQARVRLNLRHADESAAKRAMLENNTRVLSSDPRGTNPTLKNFSGDISELAPAEDSGPVSSIGPIPEGTDSLL